MANFTQWSKFDIDNVATDARGLLIGCTGEDPSFCQRHTTWTCRLSLGDKWPGLSKNVNVVKVTERLRN